MDSIEYNPNFRDGISDSIKEVQRKLREVFITQREEAMVAFGSNDPEERRIYYMAITNLLSEKLGYWE